MTETATAAPRPGASPPKEEAPDVVEGSNKAFGGAEINDTGTEAFLPPLAAVFSSSPSKGGNTLNTIVQGGAVAYLLEARERVQGGGTVPSPALIEDELLSRINKALKLQNAMNKVAVSPRADANEKNQLPLLKRLPPHVIGLVLLALHHVVKIKPSTGGEEDADLLAIYVAEGDDAGLYSGSASALSRAARLYDSSISTRELAEVRQFLHEQAPRVKQSTDRDLVPVANGVWHYTRRELLPFSPGMVFTQKAGTPLDLSATNPVITRADGTTWDVESWTEGLFDDPALVSLIWQVRGALVRPNVRWNKSAWFFSTKGNNGKGTECELERALVGEGRFASVPLDELGKDFMLESLLSATAIIVDENDVGVFLDKVANLKAVITNDVLHVNRKGLRAITFQFRGFMVQCLNEFPRFKDKSDSLYRRQLFVPFTKHFEVGEDKSIKADFVQRPEVLRYVLKKVLVDLQPYYELVAPQASLDLLEQSKLRNDPVREFWDEFQDEFVWDLLPANFLYDLFKAWVAKANPSGKPMGRRTFLDDLERIIEGSESWYKPEEAKTATAKRMASPEPLVATYALEDWYNSSYRGKDPARLGVPNNLPANFRWCLRRVDAPALLPLDAPEPSAAAAGLENTYERSS
ncbi:DNA primase family protein [Leucobacter tenebrionis]|uniref:DNA primase family protein n=1 Tax=Leucobacter tenebrionis TaxID=2873270 RepID=UPI001CA66D78|nr:phage/plasmid primase, P4 family [Leucobacter tenebrionis]QZY52249.1 DUF5906 domain-containing protein [Leucobacter tenebrionis]